ncbi:helix-turn-helix domain-containing protein, partial [Staphylococcus haemolyticus]|uniref:helix-turn-helix domain-containing protein n=1 Tax=Staphylococcus haemolyticus TaxID=1283 RepID=UPI000ACEAC7E
ENGILLYQRYRNEIIINKICVCDLSITLGLSIASTSHHLRALYKRDVLDFYKDGKMAYYYIKDIEMKSLLIKCMT